MTFNEIRNNFFESFPEFKGEKKYRKSHNDYSCDCRMAFVDYTDMLCKDGIITEAQYNKITLG